MAQFFSICLGYMFPQKTYPGTAWSVNLLDTCFIVAVKKKSVNDASHDSLSLSLVELLYLIS